MTLPGLLAVTTIEERLKAIFPEGMPNRNYVTRQMAARTVFVMLYVGAIEGTDRWIAPKQLYYMGDAQAVRQTDQERLGYATATLKPNFQPLGQRWYADNTREPIRDETLREGFARVGAILVRPGIATTSGKPRYALRNDFARLFDPALEDEALSTAISQWQTQHLSAGALARIQILRRGATPVAGKVAATFPNQEVRQLEAGPSSIISKAVIEEFAPRFLENPAVILLSESGNKVVARDDELIRAIGLRLEAERLLPDLILFDVSPSNPLLVFVEAVATDGPIGESRRQALLGMAREAHYAADQIAFVTAYLDRDRPEFKRTVAALAWQTFVWFVAEPDQIMILGKGVSQEPRRLSEFLI
jgi:hypothetical protein